VTIATAQPLARELQRVRVANLDLVLEDPDPNPGTPSDGPSALEVATTFRPAIAILDIGLPVMDGYELATRLRERLGRDAPRMIAMSGYGQQEDREHSRRAGFERHLVKPVDAQVIVSAISKRNPPVPE